MKQILTTIFIFTFSLAHSQKLTLEYIESWILSCDSTIEFSKRDKLYVIEGVPYQEENLLEKLATIDLNNEKLIIDYFDPKTDSIETTFWHNPNRLAVLINTNPKKLSKKQIEEKLINAQGLFKDVYYSHSNHIISNSQDPILFIDNKQIHHAEAKKKIFELSSKSIQNLSIITHAPPTFYGTNAKNGIVKIWTKE